MKSKQFIFLTANLLMAFAAAMPSAAQEAAGPSGDSVLGQLVTFEGERINQLVGIGLVTGLQGQGDSPDNPALKQALRRFMGHFGLSLSEEEVESKNCAVVSLTLEVPSYVRSGQRLDVRLSALGDASSIAGGVLIQAPLKDSRGRTYGVAQGRVPPRRDGPSSVAWIEKGALMEENIISPAKGEGEFSLLLNHPDPRTAWSIATAVNAQWESAARVIDPGKVTVTLPQGITPGEGRALLDAMKVESSPVRNVIIDGQTGIVVMGEGVRLKPVTVSCRGIKISVGESRFSAQETEAFSLGGETTVEELVAALQDLALDTDTVIEVIRMIHQAGSLEGNLVIR